MADPDPTRHRRTGPERLAIVASIGTAALAFLAAVGLTLGYVAVRSRAVAPFENPADAAAAETTLTVAPAVSGAAAPTTDEGGADPTTEPTETESTEETEETEDTEDTEAPTTDAPPTTPVPTFPEADPEASNFLLTGADNGACIDPDSPYAGAFGDREGMGERSDTIMVFRVDPAASRIAVLSFPRDLYVETAGSGNRARINSAYRRDDPQRLVDTIYENFGIGIDHFIQVDFCAFKTLVDAVGGVNVPFQFPARDPSTGLDVPSTGCFEFSGEHALAYVRSRHYEYENPPGSGDWRQDGTSDLGRISRQQDFLRRVLSAVLAEGPLNPAVAGGLLESAQNYVVTDPELSPSKLLEFAGVLNGVEPGGIPTYQIESSPRRVNGADVLDPEIDGDNMQEILDLFRGDASLGAAPTQQFESTTTTPPRPGATTEPIDPSETTAVTIPGAPAENTAGIVPPRDVDCS